jgi:hypothetical protein
MVGRRHSNSRLKAALMLACIKVCHGCYRQTYRRLGFAFTQFPLRVCTLPAGKRPFIRYTVTIQLRRGMVGARLANMVVGGRETNSANLPNCDPVSQSRAAELLNVSARTVTAAAKVSENARIQAIPQTAKAKIWSCLNLRQHQTSRTDPAPPKLNPLALPALRLSGVSLSGASRLN